MVSGFPGLALRRAPEGGDTVYAALVRFTTTACAASRCAWRCCCSRWPATAGQGMATIQVAETLELRRTWRASCCWTRCGSRRPLVLAIALAVVAVVQAPRARCRGLSAHLQARPADDLSPVHARRAARSCNRWSPPPTP